MYLYDFFNSLKLLHPDSVPKYPEIPFIKDTIYWGIESGSKLIDIIDDVKSENQYSIFTNFSNLNPYVTDVTELMKYLNKLKSESKINNTICTVSDTFAHAIIYEAVWLIDLIYITDHQLTFLTQFDGGLPLLTALLNNNISEDLPAFAHFNCPITKDIFLSQSIYFITNYCNCRLSDYSDSFSGISTEPQQTSVEHTDACSFFMKLLSKVSMDYYTCTPVDNWTLELQTGIENTELDFLLQQLFIISQKPEE